MTQHLLVALSLLIFSAIGSFAQAWDRDEIRSHPATFLSGVAAGVMAHEAGHAAVATAYGFDIGLHGLSIVYSGGMMTESEHLRIASAGIETQWVISECVLRKAEEKDEPLEAFEAGLVVSELAVAAAYLTFLKDHEEGDLVGMSRATGLSTDQLSLLVAIPAVLDAWRLFGEDVPAWVPDVSLGYKGAGIAATWTF